MIRSNATPTPTPTPRHGHYTLWLQRGEWRGRKRGESKFIIYNIKSCKRARLSPGFTNQTKTQTDPPTRPPARKSFLPEYIYPTPSCVGLLHHLFVCLSSVPFLRVSSFSSFFYLLRFCTPLSSYAKIIPTPTTTTTEAAEAAAAIHSIFTDYQLFVNPIF